MKKIRAMSEKELVEVSRETFNSPKGYEVSATLADAQRIGKLPRRLIGV